MVAAQHGITTSPHHHCPVDDAGDGRSNTTVPDGMLLAALFDEGRAASLEIKVALLAKPDANGVVGFTTADTVITWQNADGSSMSFVAAHVPVSLIDSREHTVVLTAGNNGSKYGLRLVAYISRPNPTKARDIDRNKPHHLAITVPVFKPSSDGFEGSIESCTLSYEPQGSGPEPSTSIPTKPESKK
jgi:hypothetical protein